jgi:predicted RNA binding protein YcfA (HicA-like mRNA interferase family)
MHSPRFQTWSRGRSTSALGIVPSNVVSFVVKVSDILRLLAEDGWYLVATRGSHRQFKHPTKPGRVTVPGKPSDDLALGTLNSILKQSGLKK